MLEVRISLSWFAIALLYGDAVYLLQLSTPLPLDAKLLSLRWYVEISLTGLTPSNALAFGTGLPWSGTKEQIVFEITNLGMNGANVLRVAVFREGREPAGVFIGKEAAWS